MGVPLVGHQAKHGLGRQAQLQAGACSDIGGLISGLELNGHVAGRHLLAEEDAETVHVARFVQAVVSGLALVSPPAVDDRIDPAGQWRGFPIIRHAVGLPIHHGRRQKRIGTTAPRIDVDAQEALCRRRGAREVEVQASARRLDCQGLRREAMADLEFLPGGECVGAVQVHDGQARALGAPSRVQLRLLRPPAVDDGGVAARIVEAVGRPGSLGPRAAREDRTPTRSPLPGRLMLIADRRGAGDEAERGRGHQATRELGPPA